LGTAPAELDHVLPALSAWRRQRHDQSAVSGWRYRVAWQPVTPDDHRPAGRWLVVVPSGVEHTDFVEGALTRHGAVPITVEVERGTTRTSLADLVRQALEAPDEPLAGVLSLLALGDEDATPGLAQGL
ncbi:hypothetical protein K7G98_36540, partial [Saccharothrix sp. MB29]|nr:hypothetical protein [Saccharothrix sp. MB29]